MKALLSFNSVTSLLSVSCYIACLWAMSIHPQLVMNNQSTAINPTRISLKQHFHQNVLDLKITAVQGTQLWPPKMKQWWNEISFFEMQGWKVTSCQGVRGNRDRDRGQSSPLDAKWVNPAFIHHNNTLMAVCQPTYPSTAQRWAATMTVIKPAA